MREVSKVCEVDMYVTASASNYLAKVQFQDGRGKVHERVLEREHEGTVNGNYLTAMTVAFRILLKPCMVTVHCGIRSHYGVYPEWLGQRVGEERMEECQGK